MELEIFKNSEFGEVRGLTINNEPYFVGKDIATALGYSHPTKAVRDHCVGDLKGGLKQTPLQTAGGKQETVVIDEGDMYALIFGSKLEHAKRFKVWVTKEVLPSIRKHGAYMTEQTIEDVLSNPDTIIRLAQDLKKEKAKRVIAETRTVEIETVNKKLQPKADYANAVIGVDNTITIRDWINSLKSEYGLKVGERKVINLLIEKKILYRKAVTNELRAYAEYVKFFSLVPLVTTTTQGSKERMHLRVTGHGQVSVGNRVLRHFKKGN